MSSAGSRPLLLPVGYWDGSVPAHHIVCHAAATTPHTPPYHHTHQHHAHEDEDGDAEEDVSPEGDAGSSHLPGLSMPHLEHSMSASDLTATHHHMHAHHHTHMEGSGDGRSSKSRLQVFYDTVSRRVDYGKYMVTASVTGEMVHWEQIPPPLRHQTATAAATHHSKMMPLYRPRAMLLHLGSTQYTACTYAVLPCTTGLFVSGTVEGFVSLWNGAGGRCLKSCLVLPYAPTKLMSLYAWQDRVVGNNTPVAGSSTARATNVNYTSPAPPRSYFQAVHRTHCLPLQLRTYIIAYSNQSNLIYIFQLPKLNVVAVLRHAQPVVDITLLTTGDDTVCSLLATTVDGEVYVWEMESLSMAARLRNQAVPLPYQLHSSAADAANLALQSQGVPLVPLREQPDHRFALPRLTSGHGGVNDMATPRNNNRTIQHSAPLSSSPLTTSSSPSSPRVINNQTDSPRASPQLSSTPHTLVDLTHGISPAFVPHSPSIMSSCLSPDHSLLFVASRSHIMLVRCSQWICDEWVEFNEIIARAYTPTISSFLSDSAPPSPTAFAPSAPQPHCSFPPIPTLSSNDHLVGCCFLGDDRSATDVMSGVGGTQNQMTKWRVAVWSRVHVWVLTCTRSVETRRPSFTPSSRNPKHALYHQPAPDTLSLTLFATLYCNSISDLLQECKHDPVALSHSDSHSQLSTPQLTPEPAHDRRHANGSATPGGTIGSASNVLSRILEDASAHQESGVEQAGKKDVQEDAVLVSATPQRQLEASPDELYEPISPALSSVSPELTGGPNDISPPALGIGEKRLPRPLPPFTSVSVQHHRVLLTNAVGQIYQFFIPPTTFLQAMEAGQTIWHDAYYPSPHHLYDVATRTWLIVPTQVIGLESGFQRDMAVPGYTLLDPQNRWSHSPVSTPTPSPRVVAAFPAADVPPLATPLLARKAVSANAAFGEQTLSPSSRGDGDVTASPTIGGMGAGATFSPSHLHSPTRPSPAPRSRSGSFSRTAHYMDLLAPIAQPHSPSFSSLCTASCMMVDAHRKHVVLAKGFKNGEVMLFNVAGPLKGYGLTWVGRQRIDLEGHKAEITCMISVDKPLVTNTSMKATILVTGSMDQTVRTWEMHSGKQLHVFNFSYPVTSIFLPSAVPTTDMLMLAARSGELQYVSTDVTGSLPLILQTNKSFSGSAELTAATASTLLHTPDADAAYRLPPSDTLFIQLTNHNVHSILIQSHENYDNNPHRNRLLQVYRGHDGSVTEVFYNSWCQMHDYILTLTNQGTLYVWNYSTGTLEQTIRSSALISQLLQQHDLMPFYHSQLYHLIYQLKQMQIFSTSQFKALPHPLVQLARATSTAPVVMTEEAVIPPASKGHSKGKMSRTHMQSMAAPVGADGTAAASTPHLRHHASSRKPQLGRFSTMPGLMLPAAVSDAPSTVLPMHTSGLPFSPDFLSFASYTHLLNMQYEYAMRAVHSAVFYAVNQQTILASYFLNRTLFHHSSPFDDRMAASGLSSTPSSSGSSSASSASSSAGLPSASPPTPSVAAAGPASSAISPPSMRRLSKLAVAIKSQATKLKQAAKKGSKDKSQSQLLVEQGEAGPAASPRDSKEKDKQGDAAAVTDILQVPADFTNGAYVLINNNNYQNVSHGLIFKPSYLRRINVPQALKPIDLSSSGRTHLHLSLYSTDLFLLLRELATYYPRFHTAQRTSQSQAKMEGQAVCNSAVVNVFDWEEDVFQMLKVTRIGHHSYTLHFLPPSATCSPAVYSDHTQALTVLLPSHSTGYGRWMIDPELSAFHSLTVCTVLNTLQSASDVSSKSMLSRLLEYYTKYLPSALPNYTEPDLSLLAIYSLSIHESIHTSARHLIQDMMERTTAQTRRRIAHVFSRFYDDYSLDLARHVFPVTKQDVTLEKNMEKEKEKEASMAAATRKGSGADRQNSRGVQRSYTSHSPSPTLKGQRAPGLAPSFSFGALPPSHSTPSLVSLYSQGSGMLPPLPAYVSDKELMCALVLTTVGIFETNLHRRGEEEIRNVTTGVNNDSTRGRQRSGAATAGAMAAYAANTSTAAAQSGKAATPATEQPSGISTFEQKAPFILHTLLRMIAWSGPCTPGDLVKIALACDLLNRGLVLFLRYMTEIVPLIRRLQVLSGTKQPIVSTAAKKLLIELSHSCPSAYLYVLGREILRSRHSTAYDRHMAMMNLMASVRKYPKSLHGELVETIGLLVKCLDPKDINTQKQLATNVKETITCITDAYPSAALHQHTSTVGVAISKKARGRRYDISMSPSPPQAFSPTPPAPALAVAAPVLPPSSDTKSHPVGSIVLYHLKTGSKWKVLEGHRGEVNAIAFRNDGALLASYSASEACLKVWKLNETGLLSSLLHHHGKVLYSFMLPAIDLTAVIRRELITSHQKAHTRTHTQHHAQELMHPTIQRVGTHPVPGLDIPSTKPLNRSPRPSFSGGPLPLMSTSYGWLPGLSGHVQNEDEEDESSLLLAKMMHIKLRWSSDTVVELTREDGHAVAYEVRAS